MKGCIMKSSFIETKENEIMRLNEQKRDYEDKKEELEDNIYNKKIKLSREKNRYNEIASKLNNIDLIKLKIVSIVQRFLLLLAMLIIIAFVMNNTIPLIFLGLLSIPSIAKLHKFYKDLQRYNIDELQILKKNINDNIQYLEIDLERTRRELRKLEYKISDIETEIKVFNEIRKCLLGCKDTNIEPKKEENLVLRRCKY